MTIFTRELTARQFYPSIEVTRDCLRLGSVDEVPMADKPKKSSPVELDPPAEALDAMSSVEILRAWIADGRLHVTFDAETFAHDVGEWGRMLADISHHVARGVAWLGCSRNARPSARSLSPLSEA